VSNVADVGGLKIAYEVSADSNSVLRLIFIFCYFCIKIYFCIFEYCTEKMSDI